MTNMNNTFWLIEGQMKRKQAKRKKLGGSEYAAPYRIGSRTVRLIYCFSAARFAPKPEEEATTDLAYPRRTFRHRKKKTR
ncbi:hypothetical protein Anas_13989 [Armadillidium nasatum]|uniref:Uncharacterized protein n=1 Tax=Armadillidium nasatum TaxID=96803 RepID=A0A5N5T1G7_9CRUS|nr:hypothetical protein Anas_13989 [Armadillidium nasatum]